MGELAWKYEVEEQGLRQTWSKYKHTKTKTFEVHGEDCLSSTVSSMAQYCINKSYLMCVCVTQRMSQLMDTSQKVSDFSVTVRMSQLMDISQKVSNFSVTVRMSQLMDISQKVSNFSLNAAVRIKALVSA